MSGEREAERELLEAAIELHARDEAKRDFHPPKSGVGDGTKTLEEAAAELGISPEYLARAEAEVARRKVHATQLEGRRRTWRTRILAGLATVAVGVATWVAVKPAPVEPWADAFEDKSHWALEVSPGSGAALRFEADGARGQVGVIDVSRVVPRADGSWIVNLDSRGLPAIDRHETLVVELSGTLPSARVYLEAGTDERWRSPPLALTADYTRHRLPLRTFEHQQREGSGWRVVDFEAPTQIDVVSIKFGHFVNPSDATGSARVAEVGVE